MSYPTDPFEKLHYDMVRAHQTFKLGYDTIMKHLREEEEEEGRGGGGGEKKRDLQNFLGYCHAWSVSINAHHESEEEVVFPFLNQKMNFEEEKEAHKVVHEALTEFDAVIGIGNKEEYDAGVVKSVLVRLRDPLFKHLDDEVDHVKPSNLRSAGFTETEVEDLNRRLLRYVQSHGDPFLIVPFMRSHTPPDLKNVWPPMPWVLRKVVVPYVLGWKYSGYWKYSPYSLS